MHRLTTRHWLAFSITAVYLVSFHLPILLACGRWTPKSAGIEMMSYYLQFPDYLALGTPFVLFANLAILAGIAFLLRGWWIPGAVLGSLACCVALLLGYESLDFGSQFKTGSGLELGPGYYLWLASALLLVVGGYVTRERRPTTGSLAGSSPGIVISIIGVSALAWVTWNNLSYEFSADRNLATAPDRAMAEGLAEHDFYAGSWLTWGPILLPLGLASLLIAGAVLDCVRLKRPPTPPSVGMTGNALPHDGAPPRLAG